MQSPESSFLLSDLVQVPDQMSNSIVESAFFCFKFGDLLVLDVIGLRSTLSGLGCSWRLLSESLSDDFEFGKYFFLEGLQISMFFGGY